MKLREVTVKNFRCLNEVTVPIGEDSGGRESHR